MAGSYTKRANSYRLRFTYKGKTYSKTIKLSKGQKIERELDKFVEEIKNGNNISSNINFITFAQKWLDDYAKPNLRERTVQGYKDYLNLRLIPYFGNMNLSDIQLYDIQKFVNSLSSTLSSETIRKYKNCLSCIFNYAVRWNFLKFNPCNGVIIPKGLDTSIKPVFLTKDEVEQLLIYLTKEDLKHQIIVRLALQCGLRRSEILGLTWNAIDFKNNTISIYQATTTIRGVGTVISDTKNQSSIRTIYVKDEIIELLKKLPKETELIFKGISNNAVSKWFKRFIEKSNLKHMRFHDLRHTHATLLIANGIDMKTVSSRLGHSNISTTMNIYTHVLSENDKKASEVI